ncbi:hypothetical protein SCHPADRAFT_346910 [Schizopora paradoxa]|uniref:F-box domain-containing protein n=1 Tax=Schizopora paradoxa TaxID=27342 RepID=A0A0H2SA91_9AGAM|nr:hypothetical protein SCHPADRAFT_346910 [Schizopora paradoxa]
MEIGRKVECANMHFLDLPEDIRVHSFSFCEDEDLLRLETVCKHMRDLVCSRRIWLPRLLHSEFEIPPRTASNVDISTLSASELKYLTISARRSQEAWSCPGAATISPTRYQEVDLPQTMYTGPTPKQIAQNLGLREPLPWVADASSPPRIDLVPVPMPIGNRHEYLVIRRPPHYIQVVEITSGMCIWESAVEDVPVIAFDVDSNRMESDNVFRLSTVSLARKGPSKICVVKIHTFTRGTAGGVGADESIIIRRFQASGAMSFGYIQAQLEGDHVVVSDPKLMWMINWRLGECIKLSPSSLCWGSMRIVEQHLVFIAFKLATKDFALKIMHLQEAFEGAEYTPSEENDIMAETTKNITDLPILSSEIEAFKNPASLTCFSATLGYCKQSFQRKDRGGSPIDDITFFVMSELEYRIVRRRERVLMLHQVRLENEFNSSNPGTSLLPSTETKNWTRVLRATQVGHSLKLKEQQLSAGSTYRCMSWSGRILLKSEDFYALSLQNFHTGSIDLPVVEVDGHSLKGQIVSMDPHTGAICCLAPKEITIRILYFGD